jgi:hypothetical protein
LPLIFPEEQLDLGKPLEKRSRDTEEQDAQAEMMVKNKK